MTHTEELDKAKRQIRALLNLGEDDGATDAEADNALRFARRLMLRHNLTETELGQEPKDPHEIAAETEYGQAEHFTEGTNLSLWESNLQHAVCALLGTVKCYITRGQRRSVLHGTLVFDRDGQPSYGACLVFFGPAEDARTATELQAEWTTTVAAMARLRFGGVFRGPGRSYCEGFVSALLEKARKIQADEQKEIAAHRAGTLDQAQSTQALVLVEATSLMEAKRKRADSWLKEEKGIHLRTGSRRRGNHQDGDAYLAGQADGSRADFSHSRTNSRTKRLS